MADEVFDVALGRASLYHDNVEQNVPTGCKLVVMACVISVHTDAQIAAFTTFANLLANGTIAEATNTNYARVDYVAGGITDTLVTNVDRDHDLTADPSWTAVATGDNWTHLIIGYSPGAASADSLIIPLTVHPFVVTPNGGNITATINADGYYKALA